LLSYEEIKSAMQQQGIKREDIYENTVEIANKVEEYDIKSGLDLLPIKVENPDEELLALASRGLSIKRSF
jgi:hypothetical protein